MDEEKKGMDFFVVECDGVNDFYKDTLSSIIERGYEISPRGLPTKEVRPAMIILKEPRERFLTCPGRYIHPYFQVLESVWIMGGRGDLEFIEYYLGNMKKYADGREEFHAPYGVRMREWNSHRSINAGHYFVDQFDSCYHSLKKDIYTRQAVMTYWNPTFDNHHTETNDRPCNIAMQFLFRNGKLDFTIFNRSNDLNYGIANTNIVQFSVMLEIMAMLLDVPMGNQIHMINSLHVYDFQGEITKRVLEAEYSCNVYKWVKPKPFEMYSKSDVTMERLNRDLDTFFKMESKIRNGENDNLTGDISLNYIHDAFILALSFNHYKHERFYEAAEQLLSLSADDLFISCLEFVARKAVPETIDKILLERIKRKPSFLTMKDYEATSRYMREH